jgi:hypothetical protein
MPTFSFTVSYDGSDQEIIALLGQIGGVLASNNNNGANGNRPHGSTKPSNWPDNVAAKFAGFVFQTASRGEKSQRDAMEAWLKYDGRIPLSILVKASGVKVTHDYAGVGSSLSRNMKKAGGPKKWYDVVRDIKGERVYTITPELVEPLKQAFHL